MKIRKLSLLFMRRNVSGRKVHRAEIKLVCGCARHCQMPQVHRIKRSAEESYSHPRYLLFLFLKAARLGILCALCGFLRAEAEAAFFRAGLC